MATQLSLDSREQALTFALMEAFTSSSELPEVLSRTHEALAQLGVADYTALCVSRPGPPAEYDWMVADMPAAFFASYPEMVGEDFVRGAVMRQPNVVLRDTEMVSREVLERSIWYRRCRELGMPLRHVMSVMLSVSSGWNAGLSLYRERSRPFSKREQAFVQRVSPSLAGVVRNFRRRGELVTRSDIQESLFQGLEMEFLALVPPSIEMMRTPHVTALLEKWFKPFERGPSGLPKVLVDRLAWLVRGENASRLGDDTWEREGKDRDLRVTYVPLTVRDGRTLWALVFQEVLHIIPPPAAWLRLGLTAREVDVVCCVLSGWDNQLIADHFRIALDTVKKHLLHIFKKLGVESRAALFAKAARLRFP